MAGRCGSNRPHPASRPSRSSPRRKRSSRGRWPPKPTRPHHPPPSTATVSIRCRPTPPPPSPATTGSCSWSARPAPARPACSPPPPTTSRIDGRVVFAVAPTAKAARTVERDTGIPADTVAKLLHERQRTDRPPLPEFQLPPARRWSSTRPACCPHPPSTSSSPSPTATGGGSRWSVTHASCRASAGAACSPSCAPTAASNELERLHRFTHPWEAAASLQLRSGDPRALDAYEAHGRIVAGTLDDHLDRIAATWIDHHQHGRSIAVVASTNDHVDTINHAIQTARLDRRPPRPDRGDTASPPARRPTSATSSRPAATTAASSPPAVSRSATATPGPSPPSTPTARSPCPTKADTATSPCPPTTSATTSGSATPRPSTAGSPTPSTPPSPSPRRRPPAAACTSPPPAAATRTSLCVVTDSDDVAEARDVLEAVLAVDRADIPAVTQRRNLAERYQRVAQDPVPPQPRCAIPDVVPTVPRRRAAQPRRRHGA